MLVLLRGVLGGAEVAVHPGFDVEDFRAERRARFTSLVPAMLARLLDAGADLAGFRAILIGGSAFDPALAERARRAGVRVVSTYGLTESCGGCVYDGEPLEGMEVAAPDGRIALRGPMLLRAYRGDAEATRRAIGAGGWFRTQDAGRVVDGRLEVFGRLDGAIVTGGEKVWPERVEAALRSHPSVADAAVVGRPDPVWGERVVAFVQPAPDAPPPRPAALREHVAAALPRYAAPKEVVIVAELPRTPLGKVRRSILRATASGEEPGRP
jgi:O-succinylbenzoic acid--CoA ligase